MQNMSPAQYLLRLLKPTLALLLLIVSLPQARPEVAATNAVLEDGYAVSTVLDGNKLSVPIHPFSILPRLQVDGRSQSLLLLDSVSSLFYGLSLPLSQDGLIERVAGSEASGYSDGESRAAVFSHPRSFAVDAKGNIYVADRSNYAIRKISTSGVTTTIAGGYNKKTGNIDGPAQNASFSADFELVFIPQMCALLISDRGNNLVRQMNLKQEDCLYNSQAGSGLGAISVSVIAVLCSLLGLVMGLVARPFLTTCDINANYGLNQTWKLFQTTLGRPLRTLCCVVKSAVAKMAALHIIIYKIVNFIFFSVANNMNRPSSSRPEKLVPCRMEVASLMDTDVISDHVHSFTLQASQDYTRQLMNSISLDDNPVLESHYSDTVVDSNSTTGGNAARIDEMMSSNISDFVQKVQPEAPCTVRASSAGLVKRHSGPCVS